MLQKLFAGLTASVLCGTMLGTLWAASAEETDAPVKKTVECPKSAALTTDVPKPVPDSTAWQLRQVQLCLTWNVPFTWARKISGDRH